MGDEKVLVTGGGGFLGQYVVDQLLEQGAQVKSFSRHSYPDFNKKNVGQITGDIADFDAVTRAAEDVDIVFHIAAKAGIWGKRSEFFKVNVMGTENIVQACLKNNVKRLVYTSSPSVVFHGGNMENADESAPCPEKYDAVYPETKALAEKKVIQASSDSLHTIILRPHLIWGPGDNHLVPTLIRKARRLKRIGDGTNRVDTIYVENAAKAHLLAAKALEQKPWLSGNVYFISQDEPVNLWDMVDSIIDTAGLPPVKGAVSEKTAIAAGVVFETLYSLLNIRKDPPMTKFAAKELATSHWFNISRAKKDLGYYPEISTDHGLERLRLYFAEKK
ncbi:MAG: NAD-dependent epimerase/dehydratase family protein [Thermodesulfobacteriota bacterium]|nr:NAD-dependent epimerase/dehydratase family protein [Thermodesulfobacteriota bacterium]